ncbi:hypothetical protein BJV74DRAFT_215721 [Russula compacta]|nr:hypothetical protein BJV74DRAFT_215721 [Russula compacta]
MKDDFGRTYTSPVFNLTPIPKSKPAAHPPDVAQPRPDQAPLSSSSSTANSNPAVAAPADPGGGTLTLPSAVGIPPNSTATWTPAGNGGGGGPLVATAHNAPPTAALAIPLSLTGAIVLFAGGLALYHRRKLAAEKERCAARRLVSTSDVASSTTSLESSARRPLRSVGLAFDDLGGGGGGGGGSDRGDGAGTGTHVVVDDAEKALFARALFRGGFLDHVFDAYHNDNDNKRRSESEAAVAAAASGTAAAAAAADCSSYRPPYAPSYSSYAHRAPPEPRQRTRQLDLLTREFTPRPRAHLSSSSYRGLFGSRHSARLSTCSSNINNNNNGGGGPRSHWRSLSFARRKVAPHSGLTSPAMTESVTSEVLPSYLPSPNFGAAGQLGGCEHGASIGDLGFENVPLSPPPPPPLHTRGEAAEPDDSRMRELRGVYEAVARALGSVRRV